MSQELTLEDKRKFLPLMGAYPMLEGGVDNGLTPLNGGFAGCCGSIFVTENAKKQGYLKEYSSRIWWQRDKGIPEPFDNGKESLLIPDVLGNVLVQWDDK